MSDRYDVIIIGSGAGSGALAHRLAPAGKKILIRERGDRLPREAHNGSVDDVFAGNRGASFQPKVRYFVGAAARVFVSIGALNPSLTIVANALPVGDPWRARLG